MPLETASTIAELNSSNPIGASDAPAALDDHIRLIKTVLKADALVEADKGVANGVATLNASSKVVQTALLADSATSATNATNATNAQNISNSSAATFTVSGSERMRIDTSGNALVNLSSPRVFNSGVVTPVFQVAGAGTSAGIGTTRFSSTVDSPSRLVLARSGSDTLGTDAVVPSNAALGTVEFQGHDGAAYHVRAFIRGAIDGSVSASNLPTAISFFTGATTASERLRIDSSGNVLVTNNTGGLGYGTGAGGTVTQATSKATAVTLNKPTGQITMDNAALAAGASVLFVLNNSVIAFNDLLLMGTTGGGNYRVNCVDVFNGGATIRVTNITGGSLSDALAVRFAIIKGATT